MIEIILLMFLVFYILKLALAKRDFPFAIGCGILLMVLGVYILSTRFISDFISTGFGSMMFVFGFYTTTKSSIEYMESEEEDMLKNILRKIFPKKLGGETNGIIQKKRK